MSISFFLAHPRSLISVANNFTGNKAVEMAVKQAEVRIVDSPMSMLDNADFDIEPITKSNPVPLQELGLSDQIGEAVFLDDAGRIFAMPPPEIPPRKARPFARRGSRGMQVRVDEFAMVN